MSESSSDASVQRLPKGKEQIEITGPNGETATLKHPQSGGRDWCLVHFWDPKSVHPRVRFGNAEHIREDVEYFKTHGKLPPRGERR